MSIRRRRRINEPGPSKMKLLKASVPKEKKGRKPTDPIKVKNPDSSKS